MSLPNILFNRGKGGLGRPAQGFDHYSGLLFIGKNATLPTGFGVDNIKTMFSIEDAESNGIVEGDVNFGVLWYHINEFFRINPKGVLYVGIFYPQAGGGFTNFTAHDWDEIVLMQNFADGKIRQLGVYQIDEVFDTLVLNALQTKANELKDNKRPLSVIYAGDISGVADLSTLTSLATLTNNYVSVVIGQDGGNVGLALFTAEGYSITTLGATLGAVSGASVHESIGWTSKFNLVTGAELDTPAFANGDLVKDKSKSALEGINDLSYIFIKKFVDFDGTYINDSHTAIAKTSDYAQIENNRTIEKAVRLTYSNMLPLLNSPLTVNDDGTLSEDTIKTFESFGDKGLTQMLRDGELSAKKISINPAQDVLSTSKVFVTLILVPRGVAREIVVNIGFATSL